jgi:ABC-type transport system substrate-binding protein
VRLRPSHDELANEIAARQIDVAIPIVQDAPSSDSYRILSRDLSTIVMLFNCTGAFHTPALRQAVLRALDFGVIRRTIDPRAGVAVPSILPVGTGNDVPFPYPPYNPARARAELAQVRSPVTMIYLAEVHRYQMLVLEIRQMLGMAGVELLPTPRPKLGYFAAEGALRSGRFDIAISGFAYDDHPNLGADWSCANAAPAGANYARFCDRQFDAALARGRDRDALRHLLQATPMAPLARNFERFAVARNVVGFEAPARFVPPTLTAQRWAVPGETT